MWSEENEGTSHGRAWLLRWWRIECGGKKDGRKET